MVFSRNTFPWHMSWAPETLILNVLYIQQLDAPELSRQKAVAAWQSAEQSSTQVYPIAKSHLVVARKSRQTFGGKIQTRIELDARTKPSAY